MKLLIIDGIVSSIYKVISSSIKFKDITLLPDSDFSKLEFIDSLTDRSWQAKTNLIRLL